MLRCQVTPRCHQLMSRNSVSESCTQKHNNYLPQAQQPPFARERKHVQSRSLKCLGQTRLQESSCNSRNRNATTSKIGAPPIAVANSRSRETGKIRQAQTLVEETRACRHILPFLGAAYPRVCFQSYRHPEIDQLALPGTSVDSRSKPKNSQAFCMHMTTNSHIASLN